MLLECCNLDPFMPADEIHKLGLETLNSTATQLIITSTGLIAFTITFVDKLKVFGDSQFKTSNKWLYICWTSGLISIIFGFFSLTRTTGFMIKSTIPENLDSSIKTLVSCQVLCLFSALTCMFIYAIDSLTGKVSKFCQKIESIPQFVKRIFEKKKNQKVENSQNEQSDTKET